MADWTIADILTGTGGVHAGGDAGKTVAGFSIDSRTLNAGDVFFAIKGETHDGHAFIPKAIGVGASAIVASSFPGDGPKAHHPVWVKVDDPLVALQELARWHRSRHQATFLGVTGSNGKTTTKEMTAHLFGRSSKTYATSGNFNNHIGLPLNIIRMPLDEQIAVIEMGMNHAGEIRFLAEISRPHSAVISNIGPAHIGLLGSLENIAKAKGEILEGLTPEGFAILPGDDQFLRTLTSKTRAQVLTFGFGPHNDLAGQDLMITPRGIDMKVVHRGRSFPMHLQLLGKHNASNALAALGLFVSQGHSLEEGIERLRLFKPVNARMESQDVGGVRLILDCYNANPASMTEAVEFLSVCSGRRVVVLGDMRELGKEGEEQHRRLGRKVAECKLDHLVAVGDLAQHIAESALTSGMGAQMVHSCRDTREAAKLLSTLVLKGDTVLLKASRGMHFEAIVKELWPTVPCELH